MKGVFHIPPSTFLLPHSSFHIPPSTFLINHIPHSTFHIPNSSLIKLLLDGVGGAAEGFGCFYLGGAGAAYRLVAACTAALGAVLVVAGTVMLVLAAIAVGLALHSVGLAEIFFGFVLIAFGTRGISAAFVYESSYSRVAVIGGSGVYRCRECAGKQSQHCEDFDKAFHRTKVVFFSFGRASVLP